MKDCIYFGSLIQFINEEIQQYTQNFDIEYEITNSCIVFNIMPLIQQSSHNMTKKITVSFDIYQNLEEIKQIIHNSLLFLKK